MIGLEDRRAAAKRLYELAGEDWADQLFIDDRFHLSGFYGYDGPLYYGAVDSLTEEMRQAAINFCEVEAERYRSLAERLRS